MNEYYEGRFTVRIDVGSYTGDFLKIYLSFLDWLAPYIDTDEYGEFIGYIQGENTITRSGRVPILLFCEEGKIYFSEVSQSHSELNETNLKHLFFGEDV